MSDLAINIVDELSFPAGHTLELYSFPLHNEFLYVCDNSSTGSQIIRYSLDILTGKITGIDAVYSGTGTETFHNLTYTFMGDSLLVKSIDPLGSNLVLCLKRDLSAVRNTTSCLGVGDFHRVSTGGSPYYFLSPEPTKITRYSVGTSASPFLQNLGTYDLPEGDTSFKMSSSIGAGKVCILGGGGRYVYSINPSNGTLISLLYSDIGSGVSFTATDVWQESLRWDSPYYVFCGYSPLLNEGIHIQEFTGSGFTHNSTVKEIENPFITSYHSATVRGTSESGSSVIYGSKNSSIYLTERYYFRDNPNVAFGTEVGSGFLNEDILYPNRGSERFVYGVTDNKITTYNISDNISDVYVDLVETTPGEGTEASPYTQTQLDLFFYYFGLCTTSDIKNRYFKGHVEYTGPYVPSTYINSYTINDYNYYSINNSSWDLSTYGPASWYNVYDTGRWYLGFYSESWQFSSTSPEVTNSFSNLVVTQQEIELDFMEWDSGTACTEVYIKNCYFGFWGRWIDFYSELWDDVRTISFYGTTFIYTGVESYSGSYFNSDTETTTIFKFYDCCFINLIDVGFYDTVLDVEFHNCYFSSGTYLDDGWTGYDELINLGTAPANYLFDNCTFDFDFGPKESWPTAQTATLDQKETFDSSLFNIPVETDPTIIERWTTEEYSTGLFGEARTGAGAWYFSASFSADFSGTPLTGNVGLRVQFSDQSTGTPTSWLWSFGDGSTSTEQNPSHTYISFGYFTVSLIVGKEEETSTETKIDYVYISKDFEISTPDISVSPVEYNTYYAKNTGLGRFVPLEGRGVRVFL